jgi:hypothetical protein
MFDPHSGPGNELDGRAFDDGYGLSRNPEPEEH